MDRNVSLGLVHNRPMRCFLHDFRLVKETVWYDRLISVMPD